MNTGLSAETRDVIETVHAAIAIPYAATTAHERTRAEILGHRLLATTVALQSILDRDNTDELPGILQHLRDRLAEHPATGYVTWEQATARTEAGASWADAVRLDYEEDAR
jgi:hypothetical protein